MKNTPSSTNFSAAGPQSRPTAPTTISAALSQVHVGAAQSFRNFAVFPLVATGRQPVAFITLDEALDRYVAVVTEVSEGGVVPELRFENKGDVPVLLLDGEELVGARQNRVLNLTILVSARSTLVIPVSCVEAGRWSYNSRHFGSAKRAMYASARASKMEQVSASLRESGARRSDQSAIWDDISSKSTRFGTRSPTVAMSDIYADAAPRVEEYTNAVGNVPGQVGAVFAVNQEVVGLELFESEEIYQKLMAKLLSSYAIEAVDGHSENTRAVALDDARDFLRRILTASFASFKALGEGEDLRLHGDGVVGGALVVDDHVIHISAFKDSR